MNENLEKNKDRLDFDNKYSGPLLILLRFTIF